MSLLQKIHNIRALGLSVKKTGEVKGKSNNVQFTFASYPDVWEKLSPELKSQGLSVGFANASLAALNDVEKVRMEMIVSDGTEVEVSPFEMLLPDPIRNSNGAAVTNSAQRTANAESYLKRTALIHFFGMSAGNEDEVERMNPRGDQTSDRNMIRLNEASTWQDLTNDLWRNAESPLHDGTLDQYSGSLKGMIGLWTDFPKHAGVTAYIADWMDHHLDRLGLTWENVVAADPELPANMEACTPELLRSAFRVVHQKVKDAAKQEGGPQS